MNKLHLYFLALLCPFLSYSQDFTATAEQASLLDEYGNVANNDTDKSGKKQGDWFYVDIHGNQIVKKIYTDNNCRGTYLQINNQWTNIKDFSTDSKYNKGAAEELKSKGFELDKNRQVLIILSNSGELLFAHLLGKWTKEEEAEVIAILKTHFSTLNISASSKMYILL